MRCSQSMELEMVQISDGPRVGHPDPREIELLEVYDVGQASFLVEHLPEFCNPLVFRKRPTETGQPPRDNVRVRQ